jgi:aryl-phospho-beta-D-glucosidase BglC (GH1 family)
MKNKIHGKILSALSAAALSVTVVGSMPTTDIEADALSGLDANGIVSQIRIGWNLGNTLECSAVGAGINASPKKFATAWGQPEPAAEQFQAVKDAGFNAVRIPVTWYEHLEYNSNTGKYHIEENWMNYVKKTVDYAIDRDMFVILNVHHEDWVNVEKFTDATYQVAENKLTSIWGELAEEFKTYDQHLIFEGMNEPRQTGNSAVAEWGNGSGDNGYSWQYINNLNAAFVRTVRAQGSSQNRERLLMLPGYCATSDYQGISNIAIPNNAGNVALSVHAYSPYYFTMAIDSKANHTFPGQSGWGENYESSLTDMFNYLGNLQNQKNAPIIIGEFSASDFNNTNDRARWATYYLSRAKEKGIPCFLWDNNVTANGTGEAHGYLYRKGCTWYPNSEPVIRAMMNVYGVTPKMGQYEEIVDPPFSWSNVSVGSDWVQLFKSDSGKTVEAWKNFTVSNWKNYVNENYDLVLLYDSEQAPELVLMGSDWNRIASSDDSDTPYVKKFTYEDIVSALNGKAVSDQNELFISATMSSLTAYGLYAVPKNSGQTDPQPQTDVYPKITNVEYSSAYHQVRFTWEPVSGATNYGIAVFLAGRWRIQTQSISASTTSYTTPKNLTPGKTYRVAVAAKVNGEWTVAASIKNAVTITVQ